MKTSIDNRIWLLITVVVCLALLVGAWFVGAQPLLATASSASDQKAAVDAQNQSTRATIGALTEAKKKQGELEAQAAELEKAIPHNTGTASFIRSLTQIAADTGVTLTNITFTDPTAYTIPETAAATTAAPVTEGESSSVDSSDAAVDASAAPAAGVPYQDALITPTNFVVLGFVVEIAGDRDAMLAFTKALQDGDRQVLVVSVNLTAATESESATLNLGGLMYVLKPAATDAAAATGTDG